MIKANYVSSYVKSAKRKFYKIKTLVPLNYSPINSAKELEKN